MSVQKNSGKETIQLENINGTANKMCTGKVLISDVGATFFLVS